MSTLYDQAVAVKTAQTEAENTANRVGTLFLGILTELSKTLNVSSISIKSSATGIKLVLTIDGSDGSSEITELEIPVLTDSLAGVMTPSQMTALKKYSSDLVSTEAATRSSAVTNMETLLGAVQTLANNTDSKVDVAQLQIEALQNEGYRFAGEAASPNTGDYDADNWSAGLPDYSSLTAKTFWLCIKAGWYGSLQFATGQIAFLMYDPQAAVESQWRYVIVADLHALLNVPDRVVAVEQAVQTNADAISVEQNRAKTVEQANAQKIATETGRAEQIENEIKSNLVTETNRAEQAEQANAVDIAAEVVRAKNAEAQLSADTTEAAAEAVESAANAKKSADKAFAAAEFATEVAQKADAAVSEVKSIAEAAAQSIADLNEKMNSLMQREIVNELPSIEDALENIIYLIPLAELDRAEDAGADDNYAEFVVVVSGDDRHWERLGSTFIDNASTDDINNLFE